MTDRVNAMAPRSRSSRRRLLRASSTVFAVGLAGCAGVRSNAGPRWDEHGAENGNGDEAYEHFGDEADARSSADGDVGDGDEEDESDGGDDEDETVVAGDERADGIDTDGSVVLEAGAEVDDNVEAGGQVVLEDEAELDGNLDAGNRVRLGAGAAVDGNVEADGSIVLEDGAEVDGNLEAAGDVVLVGDAEVDGNVIGRTVAAGSDTAVDGEITETATETG